MHQASGHLWVKVPRPQRTGRKTHRHHPDSIFSPSCGNTNSQDPKCLGVTPKEGCGASRQPLRGSAEPGKPCFQSVVTKSGRRCSGPAPAPGTDQAPKIPTTGRLAGSGIYFKKSCISDNKLSVCDLRESTRRTVFKFSPQREKNPPKVLTQCIQTGPLAQVNK